MTKSPEVVQTLLAVGGLAIGLLVYLLDRQPDSIYFIPNWVSLANTNYLTFGRIGDFLPTFVHIYAFILLTSAAFGASRTLVLPICMVWLTIDSLFEVAQITPFAQWIAAHVPAWFRNIPILENSADYFLTGTFDVLDLCFIAAGTMAAYLTILVSSRGGNENA